MGKKIIFYCAILVHIFNLAFTTGIYPNDLKIAKVLPLFKKGDRSLPENYRPISLLPCVNKLLEKCIDKRVRKYLTNNNVFYEYQFGFRKGYSTVHALLETVNTIRNYLNNGENVLGLYLDLKKAFDTVDHNILLHKLNVYGIRGCCNNLIRSYLSNRKQCMFVNGTYSDNMDISTGVPQGSVLGPLFFLIYINDVQNAVPDISLRLFADDTSIFLHHSTCANLIEEAKTIIIKLSNWFDSNKLTLHLGKTNYTIFHCKKQNKSCCSESFMVNGIEISKTSHIKYLGVTIDDQLTWQYHVTDLINTLIKYTGIFYRINHNLTPNIAKGLFYAFIHSRISYGIEVYGMAGGGILKPLQIMQNRLLKILHLIPRRFSTDLLHKGLSILKINDLHKMRLSMLLYKYSTGMLPTCFNTTFRPANPIGVITRTNALFTTTRQRNKHGKYLLNNYCLHIWQNLPVTVKQKRSMGLFKTEVKAFYLSQYV